MRKLETEKGKRSAAERNRDAVLIVLGYLVTLVAACITLYNGLLILRWASMPPDRRQGSLALYLVGIALVWLLNWLYAHYYAPRKRRR